jgi:diguanylate cyclase (GGDEF)-like protein
LALTTVRSGLLGATAGTVTVALVGLWLTVQGSGPFAAAPGLSAVGHVIILQLFILAAALCAVPLAIVFTMRKSLAEEVQHHASIKRAALDNMAQGLIMFDAEQRLIICNRRYGELYKLPRNLRIPGTPVEAIAEWKATGPDMAAAGETARQILDAVRSPEPYREMELPDGRIIVVHARPLLGGGWVSTHEDVTEQRRAAQQIAHLASHDPLTDLPNRAFFRDHLQALISRTKRGEGFALLSLDLDRFKRVNDTLGHCVGDELLKQVAQRLRTIVRESDVVTRFGGDEFAILQTGVGSREEARLLADRVVRRLSEPFLIEGHQFDIGASLGIALCPGDTAEPADLLRKSDLALYRAKSEGGETYRFFEAGMDDVAHQRRVLESQLKAAIENGEFVLHYQPILDLESGVPTSFEALVRWQHPTRGLVMPDQFIAAAEDCGLIVRIGEWVLREALREAATWPEPLRVAVNLSPVQFRSGDLVQTVRSAIAAAGIAPERLDVELTESVLLEGTQSVLNTLEQLRLMGVGIALDDFGTGYSSLGYLRTFLFDRIKIDRSFIAEMGSPESYAIVHATIGLSRQLGMTTTAEGVETAEQAAVLKAEGCTSIQGYFVSRALSAEQAKDFLHGFTVAPEAEPRKRRARAACGETAQADAKFRRSLLPRAAAAR